MAHAIALGALAILLFWPGAARADHIDEPVEGPLETAACAAPELQLNEPAGWSSVHNRGPEAEQVTFAPPAGSADARLSLDFALVRTSGPVRAEEALQRALGHLGAMETLDVRPFRNPHPRLPSAGGALRLPRGSAYVVVLVAPANRYLVARLTKEGGDASARELELFRRTIASAEIGPGAGCVASAR